MSSKCGELARYLKPLLEFQTWASSVMKTLTCKLFCEVTVCDNNHINVGHNLTYLTNNTKRIYA